MADCPTCEYHKQRAQLWRDEVYRLGGHPLPERDPVLEEPVALQYPQKDIDWQREQQIKAQASIPPQRTWVGLTDDDEIPWDGVDAKSFAQAIEAKLKEKNT